MPYSLRYDQDIDCVILTFEDTVTMDTIHEAAPHAARMCAETGCQRILNDMSTANIDVSFTEIFGSPKIMDKSKLLRDTKRALVVPPAFTYDHFLETVTRNRGHNLMVFKDIEKARQWLLSEKSSADISSSD